MTYDRNFACSCIGQDDEMLNFTSKSTNGFHVEMIATSVCCENRCDFSKASVNRVCASSRFSVDNVSIVDIVVVFTVAFASVHGKENVIFDPQHITHYKITLLLAHVATLPKDGLFP